MLLADQLFPRPPLVTRLKATKGPRGHFFKQGRPCLNLRPRRFSYVHANKVARKSCGKNFFEGLNWVKQIQVLSEETSLAGSSNINAALMQFLQFLIIKRQQ